MKCENGEKKRKFVMRKFVTVVEIVENEIKQMKCENGEKKRRKENL